MNQDRPNIILIVLDAARRDRLGCYGYDRPITPNIDRFAADSVIYDRAYSPAAWTLPVITSMFTGRYPAEHGINELQQKLPLTASTLPGQLSKLGYQTAAITGSPWAGITIDHFDTFELVDRIFHTQDAKRWHAAVERIYKTLARRKDKGAQQLNTTAQAWVTGAIEKQDPFFLYMHHMEPHSPFWPPEPFRSDLQRRDVPSTLLKALPKVELPYLANKFDLDADGLDALNDLYDAELAYLDHKLGEWLDWFATTGQLENTMVVIMADHGENLGEHNLIGHQYCLYDTLLHVPLIVRYPDGTAAQRVNEPVQTHDMMATIGRLLGQADGWREQAIRWQSYHPSALPAEPEPTYAQYLYPLTDRFKRIYPDFDYSHFQHKLWSIQSGRYKLIRNDAGTVHLFDTVADSAELVDLAATMPEQRDTLADQLDQWLAEVADASTTVDQVDLDPVMIKQLQDLGYL